MCSLSVYGLKFIFEDVDAALQVDIAQKFCNIVAASGHLNHLLRINIPCSGETPKQNSFQGLIVVLTKGSESPSLDFRGRSPMTLPFRPAAGRLVLRASASAQWIAFAKDAAVRLEAARLHSAWQQTAALGKSPLGGGG